MPGEKDIFIHIDNAEVLRSGKQLFRNLSWTIQRDQHWIIRGGNASGKTSLCQALAGKHFVRQGRIHYAFLQDQVDEGQSLYDLCSQNISLLSFADHHQLLNPQHHFYQQRFHSFDAESLPVGSYLKKKGFDRENAHHRRLVDTFLLWPLMQLETIKLSSGQMRKLLLTTALLRRPRLLIIDNPYIGLDPNSRQNFNALLDRLVRTQELQLILSGQAEILPDCISHQMVLDDHRVVYQGGLLPEPNLPVFSEESEDKNTPDELVQFYRQHDWPTDYDPLIFLKGVQVQYGTQKIMESVDWTIRQGEKWALLGENGSGKSTLLGLIAGDHPQAYANRVQVFGQWRGKGQSIWEVRRNIGFVSPELHAYFPYDFTAYHIVASGLMDGYFINRPITPAEQRHIVMLFDYFAQRKVINRPFRLLSTGEQRLLFFLRALIKNPPLLLLDEPFQGLDHPTKEKAKSLLDQILTSAHSLIFITHFKSEIPACVRHTYQLPSKLR